MKIIIINNTANFTHTHFKGATGSQYKIKARIHRSILIYDY